MPFPIKLGLTITVALVALGGWFYMGHLGQTGPQWAVTFLGPFMVIALWVVPEVTRRPAGAKKA
jgi:hypothetical protein